MKTILVLTDFTIRADNAARYALKLAQNVKANILLCNVFLIPSAEPMADQITWAMEDYEMLEQNSENDLAELAARLHKQADADLNAGEFKPLIECCSRSCRLGQAVNDITAKHDILMVVLSMHGSNGLGSFLAGNHVNEVIEKANCPVLIVPHALPFTGINKIAFASDMSQNGIEVLQYLTNMAQHTNAEILIAHVADESPASTNERVAFKYYFDQARAQINYPKMYYKVISNKNVVNGLSWLAEHSDIDILVIVHRKRNFFQKIFDSSITKTMADNLIKPMLVFPSALVPQTF